MPNVSARRRRPRTTPAANIRFDESERVMLDKQCAQHRCDMTTFLRTVVVLIDNGTLKVPAAVFTR